MEVHSTLSAFNKSSATRQFILMEKYGFLTKKKQLSI
jgi:hypothetical protein